MMKIITSNNKANGGSGSRRNIILAVIVAVAVILVGLLLIKGAASGFFGSVKVASGTVSGNAEVVDDGSAFEGKAVLFKAPPVIPEPPITSPTAVCPPFPAFPDENCTGWRHTGRTTLQNCDDRTDNGYIWDDNPNKKFIGCYFSRGLVIEASGVEIYESQIHGAVSTHWSKNYSFNGLYMADVEIENCLEARPSVPTRDCTTVNPNFDYFNAAIAGGRMTCLRCNIHNTVTGVHLGEQSNIIDSYIHHFQIEPDTNDENAPLRSHGAAIGAGQNHGHDSVVRHNNLECVRLPGQYQQCSSALSLYDEPQISNVLVENNLFNTVNGYCIYGGGTNGNNIKFKNNRFGKKYNPYCGGQGNNIPVAFFYFPSDTKCISEGYARSISPKCNWGNEWVGNEWADGSGKVLTNTDQASDAIIPAGTF